MTRYHAGAEFDETLCWSLKVGRCRGFRVPWGLWVLSFRRTPKNPKPLNPKLLPVTPKPSGVHPLVSLWLWVSVSYFQELALQALGLRMFRVLGFQAESLEAWDIAVRSNSRTGPKSTSSEGRKL